MAKKMYYSEQEAADRLGISPAELNDLVREGSIRAFMDGAKRMFRAQEVDDLAGDEAGESVIELSPLDSTAQGQPVPPPLPKDDDVVSLEAAEDTPSGGKGDTVITAEGISIFDDEDLELGEPADPMAKTQITPSIGDQIGLDEGAGAGTGLLDLTRESDDTSLGAGVLDQIDMDADVEVEPTTIPEPEPYQPSTPPPLAAPQVVEAPDPTAGAFTGMVVATMVVGLLLGIVGLIAMQGRAPGLVTGLHDNMALVAGAILIVILASALIGYVLGKSAVDRRQAMRRAGA